MKKSITTLDLNLLLCLQLLMQERSVTKAAKRMNVTPSAVSKSLAKLRAWFDDPLFVNSPLGLSPTPLMVSMEQNLAEWMQMSNLLLDKPHHQTPRGLKFELAAESPDAPRDKCTLSCAINGIHAAFHYLKKNYISGCVMTVPTG